MTRDRLILAAALLAMSAAASSTSIDDDHYAHLASALVDFVVLPAYQQHADSTAKLVEAVVPLCADPDAHRLASAREALRRTMHAWQRARPITFGPITDAAGPARVQFWPDKRGTGARQLRKALAAEDASLLGDRSLKTKSVALGDLQALERVLFEHHELLLQPGSYRCRLALAIARHQASLAQSLLHAWAEEGGHADMVKTASVGNDEYFDAEEAARDFLKSFTGTLAFIADRKLTRSMGDSIARARPKRAESWRSRQSMDNIIANLQTLRKLFDSPGGFADLLTEAGAKALADGISRRLGDMETMARSLPVPLADAVGEADQRQKIAGLRDEFQKLHRLAEKVVTREVGLSKGFNASDGD